MHDDIGKKIKELRKGKDMTLKDLSDKTDLSTGFLSQLERGLTTIAIDSLQKIADVFEIDLGYFFVVPKNKQDDIVRHHEKEIFKIDNSKFIHYQLSNSLMDKDMFPRLIEVLPSSDDEDVEGYSHEGEEFIYILEGILTLYVGDKRYDLYPGDSAHISSNVSHNWSNYTNKIVRLLAVNTPNKFKEK
ncbi:helix-turn-helix domain-containing protein [Dethiothermospora halolimnae]|uniref:helix-turn-helix domain-containing protein n=1 Tax=Dethiothermospora halolimnae TaxID=3114390 RepID=UPI003CCC170B